MHMSLIRAGRHALVATAVLLLAACGVSPQKVTVPVVEKVDLNRFMGPWYVIGVIPQIFCL